MVPVPKFSFFPEKDVPGMVASVTDNFFRNKHKVPTPVPDPRLSDISNNNKFPDTVVKVSGEHIKDDILV